MSTTYFLMAMETLLYSFGKSTLGSGFIVDYAVGRVNTCTSVSIKWNNLILLLKTMLAS